MERENQILQELGGSKVFREEIDELSTKQLEFLGLTKDDDFGIIDYFSRLSQEQPQAFNAILTNKQQRYLQAIFPDEVAQLEKLSKEAKKNKWVDKWKKKK